ncbi:hypothetical protein ACGGZK_18635 [Agromyces sp. MMS24-K17]|uniref:hypothetical protein n=1 Tax=Agromyces sp. MMS24-K17 TaxID=3372850 RepID=UPI0037551521
MERLLTTAYGFDCISRVEPTNRRMIEGMFDALWQALPEHHRALVPPELIVMSSVRGFTHTIYPGPRSPHGIHSLVFDQGLHSDLLSLTHHVVLESPTHLVDVLLLKEFARRLVLEDRRLDAAAVGLFANELVMRYRGGREATRRELDTLASMMDGQVLFILAHEIFHTILQNQGAEAFFRETIDLHVRDYLSRFELLAKMRSTTLPGRFADERRAYDAIVDVFRLPARESSDSWPDRYHSHLELLRRMVERPRLWDEFICDLFAALLTVRVQARSGLPIPFTLATCALALENLAVIRYLAREAAEEHASADGLLAEATARVSMFSGAVTTELIWQGRRHDVDQTGLAASVLNANGAISVAHRVIREPLMARDWGEVAKRLMDADRALRAAAVETSEDEVNLRGLVGFPHPGYR